MKEMKEIKVIENTSYGLFLSLLILDNISQIEFIFPRTFEKKILNKLKEKRIEYIISDYGSFKSGIINHYIRVIKNLIKNKKRDEKIKVYGNDYLDIAIPYKEYGFHLIEDGLLNYIYYKNKYEKLSKLEKIKRIIKLLPSNDKSYGLDSRTKKIYLTGLAPIPEEIIHKVEIINLKELWNKKTLEEQNNILDIFSFDVNIKEKIKGRDIILFTQPLSEDEVITEEEKVKIYLEIIKKYPKERLVIKTHPREKTNYKDIFKEYLVLDNPFPFEILNLLDVKFSRTITIFSTAALGLGEEVEVDFYGTEIHKNILEKFGSYKKIYPTTKYIKEEE